MMMMMDTEAVTRDIRLNNPIGCSMTSFTSEFRKKFCWIEGSQKHPVSVTLNMEDV